MLRGNFDSYASLWEQRMGETMEKPFTLNRADTAHIASSQQGFEDLKPAAARLLGFFLGTDGGADLPNPHLAQILNFFPRFFGVPSVVQLSEPAQSGLRDVIERTYALGIASHLILCKHPSRSKIGRLSTNALLADVLEGAGIADVILKSYNQDTNGAPGAVVREHYTREIRPLLKGSLDIGFWRVGKLESHFKNFFWAGTLLGMKAEVLANRL